MLYIWKYDNNKNIKYYNWNILEIKIGMAKNINAFNILCFTRFTESVNNFVYSKFPLGNNEWFLKSKFYLFLSKYRFYWHFKY